MLFITWLSFLINIIQNLISLTLDLLNILFISVFHFSGKKDTETFLIKFLTNANLPNEHNFEQLLLLLESSNFFVIYLAKNTF